MPKSTWKSFDYIVSGRNAANMTYRPLIKATVSNKTGSFPFMAMVDSGTDTAVLNADIAKALNIMPNTCEKVRLGGIGEKEGFRCTVTLTIPDMDASIDIPVVFVQDPLFDGLLGQSHFFNYFDVRFEKSKNKFFLKKA